MNAIISSGSIERAYNRKNIALVIGCLVAVVPLSLSISSESAAQDEQAGDFTALVDLGELSEQRRDNSFDRTNARYSKWLKAAPPEVVRHFIDLSGSDPGHNDQGALTKLNDIISRCPTFEPAYARRASVYVRLNRLDLALKDCDKALEDNPDDSMARRNRMFCNLTMKHYKEGIKDATRVLQSEPYNVQVLVDRAKAYALIGNTTASQKDAELANKYMAYDITQPMGGRRNPNAQQAAIKLMTQELNAHPTDPNLLFGRARMLVSMGNYDEALADLSRLATLPLSAIRKGIVFQNTALCRLSLRDPQGALSDLEQAIQIYSDRKDSPGNWDRAGLEKAYLLRANVLSEMNSYKDAIRSCSTYIRLFPERIQGYLVRGDIHARNKRAEFALSDYEKALTIDPYNDHAIIAVAGVSEREHKLEESIDCYTRLLKMHPDIGDFYLSRARLYRQAGKLDLALQDYSRMVTEYPDDSVAREERARIEVTLGRKQAARADLNTAIKVAPEDSRRLRFEKRKLGLE